MAYLKLSYRLIAVTVCTFMMSLREMHVVHFQGAQSRSCHTATLVTI